MENETGDRGSPDAPGLDAQLHLPGQSAAKDAKPPEAQAGVKTEAVDAADRKLTSRPMRMMEQNSSAQEPAAGIEAQGNTPTDGALTTPAQQLAERRFWDLLEASTDAILEVDAQGRILLANSAAEKLSGYTRAELVGANLELLLGDAARLSHPALQQQYRQQPAARAMCGGDPVRLVRKDRSQTPVEVSLRPAYAHGELRVTAIIRDVSERERADQMVRAARAQLEMRNREVARASRLEQELLDSVSHELRTPLHTIIGFTELLQEELEGPLNATQKRFLGHVYSGALHLLEMVNDILDLNAIKAGKMQLSVTNFDASPCVDEAIQALSSLASLHGITLQNRVPSSTVIHADRQRFGEVLYNLLSNAVKFNRVQGQAGVDATVGEGQVEFCVWDTGVGIAQEDFQIIFDRFGGGGARATSGAEGTGLGLAITKHLVELHGGGMRVESQVGEGSRFYATFPAAGA